MKAVKTPDAVTQEDMDQHQGAAENQSAGILKYVEDLRRGRNAEFE